MSNFEIKFNHIWLLLLLIPLLIVILYAFFKVNRRFRYTRNRVISCVLAIVCAVLGCLTVSGMSFEYDMKNTENELIVLVDTSDSGAENQNKRDSFVKAVLDANKDHVRVGVVKFAYDQVCAVELGDRDNPYQKYQQSENPNPAATNVEDALNYAKGLIKNPETAKIVLITDGAETDGDALKAITALSLDGIKIDLVHYANLTAQNDIMPLEVILPRKAIVINEANEITLNLQSSMRTDTIITLYDNDREVARQLVNIKKGLNTLVFEHRFESKGVHKLTFRIDQNDDVKENNLINSFAYIDIVDHILFLERDGEAAALDGLMKDKLHVTVRNIADAPKTYEDLCLYDQVVLVNVANKDMPNGFIDLLHKYVSEAGGGLLTVGGTRQENGKDVANVYNREDMSGTKYEEMLPVLAEDYTPPIGVVLVIDASGSMRDFVPGTGKTRMDVAKENALASLDALDTRDYIGVVKFGSTAATVLDMTPMTRRSEIEYAINSITLDATGTNFTSGMNEGGMLLKSLTQVNKKHIIFISDGDPGDLPENYETMTQQNLDAEITTSTVAYMVGDPGVLNVLTRIAKIGEGQCYNADGSSGLSNAIKQDLQMDALREYEFVTFTPKPGASSAIFAGMDITKIPTLNGFFGTKLKKEATNYMIGDYGQPIYAQWDYGKGKVGSFMCDLNGAWSSDFMADANGQVILSNILNQLFPLERVKIHKLEIDIKDRNVTVKANLYAPDYEGAHLRFTLNKLNNRVETVKTEDFAAFEGNVTLDLDILEEGLYAYTLDVLDANGAVIDTRTVYKPFSYSEEYDSFANREDRTPVIELMAEKGAGSVIESPDASYDGFSEFHHKTFDPRYVLISALLVLFLLDIAVRKFKFKWIHELVRERKDRRGNK